MNEGSSRGFWMSAALHGAVAAAILFFGFVVKSGETEAPKVFELVAGEGDNYMATEAPALGTPGGVSVDLPDIPEPRPAPPEPKPTPAPQEATPPPRTPEPKVAPAPPQPETPIVPDFQKQIQRDVSNAKRKAKQQVAKEQAAEKKKREAEEKKREADEKRMTKAEFDKLNKSKSGGSPTSAKKPGSTKVAKIDAEGIAKGVVGGSAANKTGGAGGKALTSDNTDVLAGYFSLFKQRLRTEFEPPPALSDSLKADIEVRIHADGSFSGARIKNSSGSDEFDRAVLDALKRVRMPARPDRKSELIEFTFTMRERN